MAILPSSQCRGINSSISCYTHSPCFTRVLHTDLFYFLLCLLLQVPAHRSFATPNHSLSIQYANRDRSSSCAMGKSRSATVVIAYLMQKHNISPSDALAHVRQARSIAEPNEGFWKQLELYSEMQTPDNVEETPAYQRWVYQRELELSRACAQAPEADKIRFEDEHATEQTSGFEMRCRKCRLVVFPEPLIHHQINPTILAFLRANILPDDHLQRPNILPRTAKIHQRLSVRTTL